MADEKSQRIIALCSNEEKWTPWWKNCLLSGTQEEMIGRFIRRFKRELIRVGLHVSGLAASGFIIYNSYEGEGVWDALGVFPAVWIFLVILISLVRR